MTAVEEIVERGAGQELPVVGSLAELTDLVMSHDSEIYLRYSKGPDSDARKGPSKEYEADVTLPGLSVTTIVPEPWWPRPAVDWVARRIRKYAELGRESGRFAWLLTGTVVGEGPDHEPLVVRARPLARLSDELLDEAAECYRARFRVGNDSRS